MPKVATACLGMMLSFGSLPTGALAMQPQPLGDAYDSIGHRTQVMELGRAKEALRAHRCAEPAGPIQARIQWQGRWDELLLAMIMAEEKLAFAAGGTFTRADGYRVAALSGKRDEIRSLFAEAARADGDAAELARLLNEYERHFFNYAGEGAQINPGLGMGLAVFLLAYRDIEYRLARVETLSAATKNRIIDPLRELKIALVDVYAGIRARGVTEINRRLPAGSRPFTIHRPVAKVQRQEADRQLLQFIGQQTGNPFRAGSFPESAQLYSVPFDVAEQRMFFGNYCPSRPRSPQVVEFDWHWSASHPLANESDIISCASNADRTGGTVWGTDSYTDDSALCVAAIHAGAITWQGGRFRIRYLPGGGGLAGSTRNGVTTRDWNSSWSRLVRVLRAE